MNALNILDSFTQNKPEWGVRELAKHLDLSHSTVMRLLVTLSKKGYVTQDIYTKKYSLGLRLLAFNDILTNNLEIHSESIPFLQKIVQKTGETAHIGVLEGNYLSYLHKVEPERPIRIFTEIGKRVPAHCIAGGKAILAYQKEEKIEEIIQKGLTAFTSITITDPDLFREHMKEIRLKGYAQSQGEYLKEAEILSIAAPIFNYEGEAFASLSLVSIAQRTNKELLDNYVVEVKETARKISIQLGFL